MPKTQLVRLGRWPAEHKVVHIPVDSMEMNRIKLHEIDFYVTMKCNLACDFCSIVAGEYNHQDLPLPRMLEIIADAADLGLKELHFSGGEPTVRPDLEDMIKFADDLGIHTRIITNGYKLPRKRIQRLVDSGLKDVMISIDGMEKQHNIMRGKPDGFVRTLTTVKRCIELGLRTRVSMVAFKENKKDVVPLLKFIDNIGVDIFSVFLGAPLGRGYRHRQKSMLNADEWRKITDDVLTVVDSGLIAAQVIVEQGYAYTDRTPLSMDGITGRGTGCATLMSSYDYLIMRSDGKLYQCIYFVDDGKPIGDVSEKGFEEVLTEAQRKKLYAPFTVPQDKCVSCGFQEECGTGCQGIAYLTTGDWVNTDSRCSKDSENKPAYFPLCPILKLNAGTRGLGGSSEEALGNQSSAWK